MAQWLLLCSVFGRRFLLTNLSNGDSSASATRWLTLHSWTLNCLVVPIVFKITSRHGPRRKHSLYYWRVFTDPLPSNGCPSVVACACVARMCSQTRCLKMDIHFTIFLCISLCACNRLLLLADTLINELNYHHCHHHQTRTLTLLCAAVVLPTLFQSVALVQFHS
jgi:hypothetical protein